MRCIHCGTKTTVGCSCASFHKQIEDLQDACLKIEREKDKAVYDQKVENERLRSVLTAVCATRDALQTFKANAIKKFAEDHAEKLSIASVADAFRTKFTDATVALEEITVMKTIEGAQLCANAILAKIVDKE